MSEENKTRKTPCKPMLKINEELKDISLTSFLTREEVKALLTDVKEKFDSIINSKKGGFGHLEAAKVEECIDLTIDLVKKTLKEKVELASKTYSNQAKEISENTKDLNKLDETLRNL
jgi:hypothetical protein